MCVCPIICPDNDIFFCCSTKYTASLNISREKVILIFCPMFFATASISTTTYFSAIASTPKNIISCMCFSVRAIQINRITTPFVTSITLKFIDRSTISARCHIFIRHKLLNHNFRFFPRFFHFTLPPLISYNLMRLLRSSLQISAFYLLSHHIPAFPEQPHPPECWAPQNVSR